MHHIRPFGFVNHVLSALIIVMLVLAGLPVPAAYAVTTTEIVPTAQGFYSSWSNNYLLVDEGTGAIDCASLDTIRSVTDAQRESMVISLASIPDGSTITSIDIRVADRADNNTVLGGTYATFVRFNNVDSSDSATHTVVADTCSGYLTDTFDVTDTTKDGTTTLEIGVVKINSGGASDNPVRVGVLSALINYIAAPTVTTDAATSITTNSAILNGTVNANDASTVVTFEYGTTTAYGSTVTATPSPVTGNTNTAVSFALSGLSPNTQYHFRVVGQNAIDTTNGIDRTFTTLPQALTVTTQAVTSIGSTTATGNGNITDLGAPDPTAHGVVWNTTGTPTTADNSTDEGATSVTGAFTSSMSGLTPNTTYYVRAYATNTAGTSYGNEVSFTTTANTVVSARSLPATGFPMGRITALPAQPAEKAYTSTDMLLEIPVLNQKMTIVGIPQAADGWDVSWLDSNAGYLAGSAFPTWEGNTVITGHVWDAYNNPGPFVNLKTLKYGDQIKIHAWGQVYSYEVQESKLVTVGNVDTVFQHEDLDWITLLSCEYYNPINGTYFFRRMIRAVLVSVE